MRFVVPALALAAALSLPLSLHATPITGQFSITGTSVTDNGSSLAFTPATVNVGASNTLYGSFTTLLTAGESGTISSPINYAGYTAGSASIVFTNAADTVTFILNSITDVTSGVFGNFTGTGTISTSAAGYDTTPATLLFSTQGNGTVTFSATTTAASPVPEPSTLALLGTGILGAAGIVRRRLA